MAGHLGRGVPDGLADPITLPYCARSGVSMHAVLKASAAGLQGAPENEGAADAKKGRNGAACVTRTRDPRITNYFS